MDSFILANVALLVPQGGSVTKCYRVPLPLLQGPSQRELLRATLQDVLHCSEKERGRTQPIPLLLLPV